MKHYDYIEWLLYKNNALPEEKHNEMELHLFNCDICMEIFLSLIDEKEVEAAGNVIPDNFNEKVINKITKNKVRELKPKVKKKAFNYYFGYYVAVASVTIFLTFSGFYTNLVDSVPRITKSIKVVEEERPNIIANFSDKIVNSTSALIGNIENVNRNKEGK